MTDIAALEAYAGQLSEAAARSTAASEKQHDYIHGDDQADVATESGPVPSIAKQARLSREGTAWLEHELAEPAGSTKVRHRDPAVGAVTRPLNELLGEAGLSVETFSGVAGGVVDATAAFAALESAVAGREINLNGRTYLVSALPSANVYKNGFFKIGATVYDACQDATSIGSATDTGGAEPAYTGGTGGTPTMSGRSTFFSRAMIACNNCRAMFVRSALAACIYTWVKGNVAFAAASRQCVVNGPQSATVGAEECQSFGFRAVHIASVFGKAMVSTGLGAASRLARLGGSYVAVLATNTCQIGKGKNARLRVTVVGGVVAAVIIEDGGIGNDPATIPLVITDRSSTGSGATASYTVDGAGTITGIINLVGGSLYSDNTEAMLEQPEAQDAIIASLNSIIHTGSNSAIIASQGSTVTGSQAAVIGSDASTASGFRSVVIGGSGSSAEASGSVVIGATNSKSIADRAVAFGRRVIADLAGSFVIGDAVAGLAATINKIFQVAAGGNVTAKGSFTGNTIYADIAEFFENLVYGIIPLGIIVALEGPFVRPARLEDDIHGVVSGTALIIAGDSPFYWAQRHMTGEFDEPLFEDVPVVSWAGCPSYDGSLTEARAQGLKVPDDGVAYSTRVVLADKPETEEIEYEEIEWVTWTGYEGFDGALSYCQALELKIPSDAKYGIQQINVENPDFDPTQVNIPRSERPAEWSCVGVTGQVQVRVAEDVKPGDYLLGDNGVGVTSPGKTNLRCMRIRRPYDAAKGYAVARCFIR